MVSESAGPVMLCVELDLSSAAGDSLGCDVTVTLDILDGTNAGINIHRYCVGEFIKMDETIILECI